MNDSVFGRMNPPQKPIGLRLRKDIAWQSQDDDRAIHCIWIAEDPLTRRIFRCSDREYRLLHWLDEEATFDSLQQNFHDAFAPETIEFEQIRSLVAKCTQSGMLLPVSATREAEQQPFSIWPQNQEPMSVCSKSRSMIAERMRLHESNWIFGLVQWLSVWLGKLAQAQYSFGSPDRFLAPIAPRLGWLYSGTAVCFWLGLLGMAVGALTMRSEVLVAELPDLQAIRSPSLLVGYGVIFVLTRLIHEIGHAVVCIRAGASCKDAGLVVSFGMICPYVDITDSWRVGSRTTRMGVAMAGIYTECVLAFLATAVWLSTHPGWFHDVALKTMLVCSVTTLLFNANPLMKYDGYFVLCDWLNTQNLRERSFESLDSMLDGRARRESFGFSLFLWCYFVGATINRVVLMAGLLTMVYLVASQLQLAGFGVGVIVLYGCCWAITSMAAWSLARNSRQEARKLSNSAVWLGWTAISLLIAWAVNIPLPSRVYTVGTFQLGDRQALYSALAGRIISVLPASATGKLEQDDLILEIENATIEKQVLDLETARMKKVCQLDNIEKRTRFFDNRAIEEMPMLRSEIAIASSQLEQKRNELLHVVVSAPSRGCFEPAVASVPDAPKNPAEIAFGLGELNPHWVPSLWATESSKGRWLELGSLIGWMVYDHVATIECRLPEEQISGIQIESEVRVCLAQSPTEIFIGRVVEMARMGQKDSADNDSQSNISDLHSMTYRLRIQLNENRDWSFYSNGNAELVFVRPNQSIMKMALDNWMRNSKMR